MNGIYKFVTENWDRGGSQESVDANLSEIHRSGNIEPEESTFCGQIGIPVER